MDNTNLQVIELASTLALRTVHSYMESITIAKTIIGEGYIKQRNGEWIWKGNGYMNALHCSLCNKTAELHHKFCPNCGAKMKGGAE